MRRGPIIALLVAAATAGCGGSERSSAPPQPSDPAATVIRSWADTLRKGDIAGASQFFALPSVVENGTPPIVLRTRADVRAFNESLPCGAKLVRTSSASRFTTAVFRLTERPGPGSCGPGTGQTARTTFEIRNGKIRQWRRVSDRPQPSGPVI